MPEGLYYRSSRVGPQQGPSAWMLLEPIEWDWVCFRSKEKLYSLIQGWVVSWAGSRAHPPNRLWPGLLCRVWKMQGRGRVLSGCTATLFTCWIAWCLLPFWTDMFMLPRWVVHAGISHQTLVQSASVRSLHVAPYEQVRLDLAQRNPPPQKKLDFILLPDFIFISGEKNGLYLEHVYSGSQKITFCLFVSIWHSLLLKKKKKKKKKKSSSCFILPFSKDSVINLF